MMAYDPPRRGSPLAPTRYADGQQRRLLLSLARMPTPERWLIELHVWERMTVQELARALELDVDATSERLRDAIALWRATCAD